MVLVWVRNTVLLRYVIVQSEVRQEEGAGACLDLGSNIVQGTAYEGL